MPRPVTSNVGSPLHSPDIEPLIDADKPSRLPPDLLQYYIALGKNHPPSALDTWNGYPWARRRLLQDIERHGNNTVILSGDLHTSIAGELALDNGPPVSVEFVTTSVSSPGFNAGLPERWPGAIRDGLLEQNPNLSYMDTDRRGWLCVTFTHEKCVGEWHLLDTVHRRDYTITVDKQLTVKAGAIDQGLIQG